MRGYFPVEPLHHLQIHNVTPAAVTLPVLGKLVGLYTRPLPDPGGFYLVCIVLEFFQLEGTVRRFARKKKKPLTKATQIASVKTNAEKRTQAQPDRLRLATGSNVTRFPVALHWSSASTALISFPFFFLY